jgi:hypothetical protein
MLARLWRRLFYRIRTSPPELVRLTNLEDLARSGAAGWLLAQERARIEYLASREAYQRSGSSRDSHHMLERLLHLQSTNAIVQSLINEQQLERMLEQTVTESATQVQIGKSR